MNSKASDEHGQKRFVQLVEPLQKPLLSYIANIIWNKNDLEDALQNTLLMAYKKFGETATSNFREWLFQTATYTVYNMNRKYEAYTTRFRAIPLFAPKERDVAAAPQITNEIADDIKDAIKNLPENEQSVFLLRALGGFSYAEIARILAIPAGSVMGYLSRARARLRKCLMTKSQ
ncbi:MAG: RNA polymerase sigma factor [Planctomycetes bacterium]|nr:RNA polymerase sigma factor [Planctomycetota bacterium]